MNKSPFYFFIFSNKWSIAGLPTTVALWRRRYRVIRFENQATYCVSRGFNHEHQTSSLCAWEGKQETFCEVLKTVDFRSESNNHTLCVNCESFLILKGAGPSLGGKLVFVRIALSFLCHPCAPKKRRTVSSTLLYSGLMIEGLTFYLLFYGGTELRCKVLSFSISVWVDSISPHIHHSRLHTTNHS